MNASYETQTDATAGDYETMTDLFRRLNDTLWSGTLPPVIFTLQRKKGAHGYFSPRRFSDKKTGKCAVHEIALNPDTMNRSDREVASTLLHEMCHHWQECLGKPSRGGYHNAQWADEMERVGLEPVSDKGTRTGPRVSHTIMDGGAFDTFWKGVEAEGVCFKWFSAPVMPKEKKASSKIKYSCPHCGLNAWAKPNCRIECADCNEMMEAEPAA